MNTREIPPALLDRVIELARDAYQQMPLEEQEAMHQRQAESYGAHAAQRGVRQAVAQLPPDFQARCQAWLNVVTAGDRTDLPERIARFVEEALELAQSLGMERDAAVQLVNYTFDRPPGQPRQEFGGAVTTLAVLAEHTGYDMIGCGEAELARVWDPAVIEKIRGKRSRRHGRGPLPGEADLVPGASS